MNDNEGPISAAEPDNNKNLIKRARKHFKAALDADRDQRRDGMDDIKFAVIDGAQWDSNQKKERGQRPCYQFNKTRVTGKRIINAMRDAKPAGKIIGTEDNDADTAEVFEGLIRNIWVSGGDAAIDYAAEYQVFAGYGAFRIKTEYADDDVFDQDIVIEPVLNPFCLFADATAKDILKRDADHWIYTDKLTSDEYEDQYKGKEKVSFETHEFDDDPEWATDEEVRIAEYWYKKPITKTLYQLADGKVVDDVKGIPPDQVKKTRECKTHEIWMCVVSGNAVIESPVKWPGKHFPWIPVYGEYYIIDGKIHWNGITRPCKDPQRSYNVSRTSIAETIAMAPQAKYWATAKQAEGNEKSWKTAHYKNYPYLIYTADPEAPGPPTRMGGADVPIALIQESQIAAEEINMVSGIYQSDIGAPNTATSGRQEIARQNAGSLATYNYQDNMSNAVEHAWTVLIDLVPKVIDTERSIRVLGADETPKYMRINQTVGGMVVNDLSVGKYDVIVKTGPNFSTKRQEAAETYQGLLHGNPDMFPLIGDLIFRSMDLPYAEEISQRLKVMAPPEIQGLINGDQEIPPEVQAMMQQAEQAMAQVQQQSTEAQQIINQSEVKKSEVEKMVAELGTKQSQFEAKIAKELAKLAKIEAGLEKKALEDSAGGVIEATRAQASEEAQAFNAVVGAELAEATAEAIGAINEQAREFSAAAVGIMEQIKQAKDEKPLIKAIRSERVDGKLVAIPEYDEPTIQ